MPRLLLLVLPLLLGGSRGTLLLDLHEGDECKKETVGSWRCTDLRQCPQAGDPRTTRPNICGFKGRHPVVCCPPSFKSNGMATKYCSAQERLAQCSRERPPPQFFRVKRFTKPVVVGGIRAKGKAHPYMALVGYGPESSKEWLCGGTLIHDRYILTAAHCKTSSRLGEARWIRMGDLDISSVRDDAKPVDHSVEKFTAHPGYEGSAVYNDIALVRTERKVEFNRWVRPACLQTPEGLEPNRGTATGWGRTEFAGPTSDHLMEVDLSIVEGVKCKRQLGKSARLPRGVDPETMICAGEDQGGKDTCSGDSGGPLITRGSGGCLKTVSGVTSFGRQCALPNTPGIYTRVSHYVPWVESVVWPNAV